MRELREVLKAEATNFTNPVREIRGFAPVQPRSVQSIRS